MARTPLMNRVQDAVSVVAEATARKVEVEQVLEERTTRRELLKRAGAVGVAAAGSTTMVKAARAASNATAPRIAVVRSYNFEHAGAAKAFKWFVGGIGLAFLGGE